jgi:fatty acid desaturase
MVQFILGKVRDIMEMARTQYGVNPIVFLVMYVGMAPFWYYTIYRTIRAVARKNGRDMMLWGAICLVVTVAPYVYVLIFGRNMPWWIYIIVGLLVAQGIYSLVRKLTKKPAAPAGTKDGSTGGDDRRLNP